MARSASLAAAREDTAAPPRVGALRERLRAGASGCSRHDARLHDAPVQRVLIANRGEIALRIARGCRALGLSPIVVYSEADRSAPHVLAADAAVCVGPPAARESYLNADALLAAARETGADAVHPGYGFFSENAGF